MYVFICMTLINHSLGWPRPHATTA